MEQAIGPFHSNAKQKGDADISAANQDKNLSAKLGKLEAMFSDLAKLQVVIGTREGRIERSMEE